MPYMQVNSFFVLQWDDESCFIQNMILCKCNWLIHFRIPLSTTNSLMRNIPMEKLARSYYEQARFQLPSVGSQGILPRSPIVSSSASASSSPQTNRRSSNSIVQANRYVGNNEEAVFLFLVFPPPNKRKNLI